MFDLFVPYLIGAVLGLEPGGAAPDMAMTAPADQPGTPVPGKKPLPTADQDPAAVETAQETEDATRAPEPQIATGNFTTAVEVRPILGMTKSNWVAVRLYEGQDLVYFTHLLSWRCGLWDIHYGINGAPATEAVALEPCHDDTSSPNAMTDMENYLPYIALPPESVDTIYVEITFDDGTTDFAQFSRAEVLIP